MALGVGAARREAAAKIVEAQRQALLKEANCGDDESIAEFIQIGGGPTSRDSKIRGAYQRIIEGSSCTILYQRLDPESCDFCPTGPFLEFGAHGPQWKVTNTPGGKKSYARNKDSSRCPAKVQTAWEVYTSTDGKFIEDLEIRVVELPLGFCLTATPTFEREVEFIDDGPAKGTEVIAWLEQDESQHRRLSPRALICLPGNLGSHRCRGLAELKRATIATLDDKTHNDLWDIYKRLRNTLTSRVDETYFYFHPCSPTLFFRKIDADLHVPDVSARNSPLSSTLPRTKSPLPKLAELQVVEEEIVAREEEEEEHDPAEAMVKRRRKQSEEHCVGSSQDPFMKSISRDDPTPRQDTSAPHGSQTKSRRASPEVSAIAADFRALRRSDPKTRERILAEAAWRSWYPELVKMGTLSNDVTDEQLDEIWLWCIALQYSDASDLSVLSLLSQLAIKTMRGSADRFRPVLARLLCLWDALPPKATRIDTCICESDIVNVALDLLQGEWHYQGSIVDEIKMLEQTKVSKTLSKWRLAKKMFNPGAKPLKGASFWHQSLVSFAFGVVFSSMSLVSLAAAGLKNEVTNLVEIVHTRLNSNIEGIVWVRLAALYIGATAPLHESGAMYNPYVLAESAPKELQDYVTGFGADRQPAPDFADVAEAEPAQLHAEAKSDTRLANLDVSMEVGANEVLATPSNVGPEQADDTLQDLLAWREIVTQTLNSTVEQINGEAFGEMSSAQLWKVYDTTLAAESEGNTKIAAQRALHTSVDKAGSRATSWRFFSVAERLRRGVGTCKGLQRGSDQFTECKHFLTRAYHLYGTLLRLSDATRAVQAIAQIRLSQTRELLFVLIGARHASKQESVKQHMVKAKCLICDMSLQQLSQSLLDFWGPQNIPQKEFACDLHGDAERPIESTPDKKQTGTSGELAKVEPSASDQPSPTTSSTLSHSPNLKEQPQPAKTSASPQKRKLQETGTSGEEAKTAQRDVPLSIATQAEPCNPPTLEQPMAKKTNSPQKRKLQETVASDRKANGAPPVASSDIKTQTKPSNPALIEQPMANKIDLPQDRNVQAATITSHANARPRQVDVCDLRPELGGRWYLIVQVLQKIPFQTGSGFQAILGDVAGDKIAAFFFREAASKNDASIRVGLRLRLCPVSALTHVRKSDLKFGGRFQLIVGSDSSISLEHFRLGRLPHNGQVEVVGIISWVSEVEIARNGVPYRRMLLVDETCIGGVDWFCWGSFVTDLPDALSKGALVHVKAADIASPLGRRRHIRNGEATVPQPIQYDERMKELLEWSQQFGCS